MSTRGAGRAPRRARQTSFAALAALAALALGACGEEDFSNEPARASAPINVVAKIDQREVVVSPNKFGAGVVIFTITNFSDSPIQFTLSGPKDFAQEIPAGAPADSSQSPPPVTPSTATLRVEVPEGSYEASAVRVGPRPGLGRAVVRRRLGASAQPDTIRVGPKRPGSENELLLP